MRIQTVIFSLPRSFSRSRLAVPLQESLSVKWPRIADGHSLQIHELVIVINRIQLLDPFFDLLRVMLRQPIDRPRRMFHRRRRREHALVPMLAPPGRAVRLPRVGVQRVEQSLDVPPSWQPPEMHCFGECVHICGITFSKYSITH